MSADKDFDELVRIFNGPDENLERISHYIKRAIAIKEAELATLKRLEASVLLELRARERKI